jgi:hypothetical protein
VTAQGHQYDQLSQLPLVAWQYRVVSPPDRVVGATEDLLVGVDLSYRLDGDTRDVLRRRTLRLHRVVGGTGGDGAEDWQIVSDDPVPQDAAGLDLWDLGDVTVTTTSRVTVVAASGVTATVPGRPTAAAAAAGRGADLESLASATERAAVAVDAAWGTTWRRRLVVLVPADRTAQVELLGGDPTDPAQRTAAGRWAALTTGQWPTGKSSPDRTGAEAAGTEAAGTEAAGAADRVVVDLAQLDRLTPVGRSVVLTHELTHVAVRAATHRPVPLWLQEGAAQYLAYRGAGVAEAQIAAAAVAAQRSGRLARRLPPDATFTSSGTSADDLDAAYAVAWVAAAVLAERAGPAGLVADYRCAAGIADPGGRPAGCSDEAMRIAAGSPSAAFAAAWWSRLSSLSGTAHETTTRAAASQN